MINFNTVNKANTAQSLLPTFSETADIIRKIILILILKNTAIEHQKINIVKMIMIIIEMIKDTVMIKKIMKQ